MRFSRSRKWGFHTPGESKSKCCCRITRGEDMKPKDFCFVVEIHCVVFLKYWSIKAFWTLYYFLLSNNSFSDKSFDYCLPCPTCQIQRLFSSSYLVKSFWLLPAMTSNPEGIPGGSLVEFRSNSKQFFGWIRKQFPSSSLAESRRNSKQLLGQIQKQFPSSSLAKSRRNFQAVFWLNPGTISSIFLVESRHNFKQFYGRIQPEFQAIFFWPFSIVLYENLSFGHPYIIYTIFGKKIDFLDRFSKGKKIKAVELVFLDDFLTKNVLVFWNQM